MPPTPPALAYRRAAAQQASVVGLVIALYDTLAGNLRRATLAMHQRDLEQRGEQLKHGFSVLTQLVSLLDLNQGGQTALNLQRFYDHIRQEMLRAQFAQDPAILEGAADLVLDVRGAWQEVDTRSAYTPESSSLQGQVTGLTSLSCIA